MKSRFQFYTQLHQTPCHNTTNMDCLKKIMLEITCHHFEGRNKRVRGPHFAQAWGGITTFFSLVTASRYVQGQTARELRARVF